MTGLLRSLPAYLTTAAEFAAAYQAWPTNPEVDDMPNLCAYAESALDKADDAIRARDTKIEELESEIKDLNDEVESLREVNAALTARGTA